MHIGYKNWGKGREKMVEFGCAVWFLVLLISELYSCGDVETGSKQDRARLRGYCY